MRILVGALGNLGYLVKPLPAVEGQPAWRRFEDEAGLCAHLREISFGEPEIRSVLRAVRAEGRVVVSAGSSEASPRAPLARRATPAHSTASR